MRGAARPGRRPCLRHAGAQPCHSSADSGRGCDSQPRALLGGNASSGRRGGTEHMIYNRLRDIRIIKTANKYTGGQPMSKYADYILTDLRCATRATRPCRPGWTPPRSRTLASHKKMLSLDDTVLKGSFYNGGRLDLAGRGRASIPTAEPNSHAHGYDETVAFFGTDFNNPTICAGRSNTGSGRKVSSDEKLSHLPAQGHVSLSFDHPPRGQTDLPLCRRPRLRLLPVPPR